MSVRAKLLPGVSLNVFGTSESSAYKSFCEGMNQTLTRICDVDRNLRPKSNCMTGKVEF